MHTQYAKFNIKIIYCIPKYNLANMYNDISINI